MPDPEKEPGVSEPKNEEKEKKEQTKDDTDEDTLAIFPSEDALSPFE